MDVNSNISLHHHFEANKNGRDFFVGDIHGKYLSLISLLKKIDFKYDIDRLFSVGDVTDRGEDSYKCLMLTNEKWFYPVLGNHESFILNIDEENSFKRKVWNKNGGSWWWNLKEEEKINAKKLILDNYLVTLSVDTKKGKVGVLHAQYPFRSWPLEQEIIDKIILKKIIWGREDISEEKSKKIKGVDYLVFGHTPTVNPKMIYNKIYIDTGCGYEPSIEIPNPRLTICEFFKEKIIAHSHNRHEYTSYEIK